MRLMFVPGFTQRPSSWSDVLAALPLRTHATALSVPEGLDFAASAVELGARGGKGCWVGYSMGGRLALQLALLHPELVEALVLVSSTAGLRTEVERTVRRADDETLAQHIEAIGVDAFLDEWLTQPMFASIPPDASGVHDRRTQTAETLTHQLRALGTGAMPNLWDTLPTLQCPVLVVTGTEDTKFTEIGRAMVEHIPGALHAEIEGSHALPLVAPRTLAAAISWFVHEISS